VIRCEDSGLLERIGVDVYALGGLLEALKMDRSDGGAGLDEDRIVGINQGWKLMTAIKAAERALAEKTLTHGGRALMAWAVGNARVVPKGNAVAIEKQVAGRAKIDPLMALFNAVELMSRNPEARYQFVTDELVVL
jgi:phage terminase large subunit-like protein